MKTRINTLILAVITLFFVACDTSNKSAEAENIALVEKYQQALNAFDYETMQTLVAEDFVSYGPSSGDSMGREDLMLNWKHNMENLYDKLELVGVQNVALTNYKDGQRQEWVSSWGKLKIKYKNHSNEAIIWSNSTFHIVDGKIKKSYKFFNEADALRQLGFKYTFQNPVAPK